MDHAGLIREARLTSRLSHPGIVTLLEVIEQDDTLWLAMQMVPVEALHDLVRREGKLRSPRVVRIGEQVTSALEYAHGRAKSLDSMSGAPLVGIVQERR